MLTEAPIPLEVDSLLHDRYRILAELGLGGMSAVYRGYDEGLGVEVAIKENLATTPEAERQFKRGATLLASLRHPNLPRVTDHFVIPEQGQYLVMDFVPGEDARRLLERNGGPLGQAEVLRWAKEILDALLYLHTRTQPIIHRDIKPGNIKITPDGRAVLVDFGLAKFHDPTKSTTMGAKALTPGFAPPEQYGQGRTDVRTDIYSLAATLYNLLSAQLPADGLERAMGKEQLIQLRQLNPTVLPHVAEAIERGLAVKPENRFANAEEFAQALLREVELPSPPETQIAAPTLPPIGSAAEKPDAPSAAPRLRRTFAIVLVSALLLGIGGAAGLLASGVLRARPTPMPTAALPGTESVVGATGGGTATPTLTQAPTGTPPPTETPTPAFSPTLAATPRGGGTGQIAFVSERVGAPQIFLVSVDGTGVTQLTTLPDGACQPAWSPDGQQLLFISPCRGKDDEYPNAAIYRLQMGNLSIQPLITLVGSAFDPDWSKSGIAFTYVFTGKARIWVARSDGTGAQQISQTNAADRQPSWSPGADRLAYMNTSRAGQPTLFWMFQDGTFDGPAPDQVTRDRPASSPDWSPQGDRVAYVVDRQIWVVKWDTKGFGAVALTTKGPNADPDWSPDGQWTTFESWRDAANHEIFIMAANGGLQTRITDHVAQDYQPAWRP